MMSDKEYEDLKYELVNNTPLLRQLVDIYGYDSYEVADALELLI